MKMNRRRFFKLLPALFGGTVAAAKAGPKETYWENWESWHKIPDWSKKKIHLPYKMQPYQKALFTSTPTGASPFYEYHFRRAVRKTKMEWEKSLISMLEEDCDE